MNEVFFQQIINGLTIGMVYALIALGYTMVYGIVQLINFAHGEVFMVGAYLGLFAQGVLSTYLNGIAPVTRIAIVFLFTMLGTGILGVSIERFAYKPLRKAPRLAPLITAIGMSFLLQNAIMLIFGPADKSYPAVLDIKKYSIGSITFTNLQILIAIVSLILMVTLQIFIKKSNRKSDASPG